MVVEAGAPASVSYLEGALSNSNLRPFLRTMADARTELIDVTEYVSFALKEGRPTILVGEPSLDCPPYADCAIPANRHLLIDINGVVAFVSGRGPLSQGLPRDMVGELDALALSVASSEVPQPPYWMTVGSKSEDGSINAVSLMTVRAASSTVRHDANLSDLIEVVANVGERCISNLER